MPLFFLLAACLALVLVGVGVVLALLSVAAIAAMAALGITSSAIWIGYLRRSLASGLRAAHYQICVVIGIPAGVAMLGIAIWVLEIDLARWQLLAAGATGGACAGLLLALACDRLACVVRRRVLTEFTQGKASASRGSWRH